MTRTGIAAEDRKVKQGELDLKREQFKWQKRKDINSGIGKQLTNALGIAKFAENDPAWYKRYVKDMDKFVHLPTYFRLGTSDKAFRLNITQNNSLTTPTVPGFIPGIMALEYYPVVGPTFGSNNAEIAYQPLNQILMRTKEQVLKSNSRSSVNWEAADLGYNFISVGSILQLLLNAIRVLKIAQTYHPNNAFLAKRIVQALKWDAAVLDDLPTLRKYITIYIKRFNSALVAPADLTYYSRVAYLSSQVFLDSEVDNALAQMYAFVPLGHYVLSNDTTKVEFVSDSSPMTISSFASKMDLMFNRLAENPDYIEMFADLRSAFGDKLLTVPEMNLDEEFKFNTLALNREQIHNAMTLPGILDAEAGGTYVNNVIPTTALNISQTTDGYLYQGSSTDGIQYNYTASSTSVASNLRAAISLSWNAYRLCDMSKTEITGDDILDITRCKFNATATVNSATITFSLVSYGTEIINNLRIYDRTNDYLFFTQNFILTDGGNVPMDASGCHWIVGQSYHQSFDWAPFAYTCWINSSTNYTVGNGDLYHPFPLDYMDLEMLHSACLLSLFYIDSTTFKY